MTMTREKWEATRQEIYRLLRILEDVYCVFEVGEDGKELDRTTELRDSVTNIKNILNTSSYTLADVGRITTLEEWKEFVFERAFLGNGHIFSCKDQWEDADDWVWQQLDDAARTHLEQQLQF